jgi:hypothetical protein
VSDGTSVSRPGEIRSPEDGAVLSAAPPDHRDEADAGRGHADLGRRNDRLLLALVGGYVAVLSVLMIAGGVAITPDVLLVALGLATVLLGRGRIFLRDWVPFIGLFFAYELMRGYADDLGAKVHDADILALELALFGGYLPTQVLQDWLHPASGVDLVAVAGTIFYFLHFPLPIAVAFFLWLRRRRLFYDFVAGMIVLSMAGFVTYLFFPVAPPWWAADRGLIPGPDGLPAIEYLKPQGFADLAAMFGFEGRYLYTYAMYEINPNLVAAFPSLHAGYPFLAFLFARRSFGRLSWGLLAYSAIVWFSIVYLADHYVVDILGGLVYAGVAYWLVIHGPARFRRVLDRAADDELGDEAEGLPPDEGRLDRLGRSIRWPIVRQGAAIVFVGLLGVIGMSLTGFLGGSDSPLFLVPWFAVLGGLWRAAAGLVSR